jgi:exosortase E/protease (VPEID-CTERM system)
MGALWDRTAWLTFWLVELLLRPYLRDFSSDPSALTMGTPVFSVFISSACSGVEGAGLMLVFTALWLWLYRGEYRFPRAFLLLPFGAFVIWLVNALRIALLVLIGNAGAPGVAVNGFHSQAGWIAFNAVALSVSIFSRRVAWLNKPKETESSDAGTEENPVAPWLLPFLAILVAGMLSNAATSGFEWLYPLRFLAAGVVLWHFRAKYTVLDWRISWVSPLIGILVFVLWIELERPTGGSVTSETAVGLASLPRLASSVWLVFRVAAAVITVPISEELAFRGFLIRRLIRSDFDSLSLKSFTWPSVLISSAAFGLMHAERWMVGFVAGVLYSAALLWRGRLGDAIVAHATTNALLAAWVLAGGHWNFW